MRGALPMAVMVLGLLGAACGSGPSTATTTASPSASARTTTSTSSTSTRSTTVSVSFGSPSAATPSPRATATATATSRPTVPATLSAVTPAATPTPAACAPADVSITTTTDHSHYAANATVTVSVVVKNVSSHGCLFSTPGEFAIEPDPTGAGVYAVHLACPTAGCQPINPGGIITYPIPWNQTANEGATPFNQRVPTGPYHARATFPGYAVSTSTPFVLDP